MVLSSDFATLDSFNLCRRYAQQCLDAAERAPPDEREDLLEMAKAWLALAHDANATGTTGALKVLRAIN